MRPILVVSLVALLSPATAVAQTAPASTTPAGPSAVRTRGGDITRDEYIDRAKRAAEKRFDRMDANHDGVLTAEERRAARAQRHATPPQ